MLFLRLSCLLTMLTCIVLDGMALKRITSIEKTSNGRIEKGIFSYNEKSQLSKMEVTKDGYKSVFTYTYSPNGITITSGADYKNTYVIEDGRVVSSSMLIEGDIFQNQYSYNDNCQLVEIIQKDEESIHKATFTWKNGNLLSRNEVSIGEGSNIDVTYSYGEQNGEQMLQALFGINYGDEPALASFNNLLETHELIALYPYLGVLPKNLYSSAVVKESSDEYTYKYSYETNTGGDITKVKIVEDDFVTQYVMTWEDVPASQDDVAVTANIRDDSSHSVYTISGHKVHSDKSSHRYKGMYVVDGRKILSR